MTLHLVTDLKRLAPGLAWETAARCLLEQVHAAAAAGIDVIQVREPDLDGRRLTELTASILAAARHTMTRVVVNDRLDVAVAAGADGVHLRSTSFDAAQVRACAPPGFLIGRSVHSPAEAAAAGPLDYLLAGTVWATASKPDSTPLLGLAGLADVVKQSRVPVLAIGGADPSKAADLARAGASGAAGIGTWMAGTGRCRAVPLGEQVTAFRRGFEADNMKPRVPPHP